IFESNNIGFLTKRGDTFENSLSKQLEESIHSDTVFKYWYATYQELPEFAKNSKSKLLEEIFEASSDNANKLNSLFNGSKDSPIYEQLLKAYQIYKFVVNKRNENIKTDFIKYSDELISYEIEKLKEGVVTPNMVLKDPYVLDFLELNDRYLEKDLEDAILRDIENFILELGNGFSFIARQKRVQIGDEDFYIDLLFYNRKLKRLIALDLKLGKFKAEYKGQMELYLKYLEKYEKEEDENTPLGIILCSDKNQEQIELLELEKSDIHVAKYLTILPPKEEFEKRLHKAIQNAKEKYQIKG
ncbi:MAG: AIPR family protein, partial [Arcobacter sp.]|nr:AIPR family protein [Arcobacter sp.]